MNATLSVFRPAVQTDAWSVAVCQVANEPVAGTSGVLARRRRRRRSRSWPRSGFATRALMVYLAGRGRRRGVGQVLAVPDPADVVDAAGGLDVDVVLAVRAALVGRAWCRGATPSPPRS